MHLGITCYMEFNGIDYRKEFLLFKVSNNKKFNGISNNTISITRVLLVLYAFKQ